MLEKKGTDYKVYLESEPQFELRSELGKYFVGVQFSSQSSDNFTSLVFGYKFRLCREVQILG